MGFPFQQFPTAQSPGVPSGQSPVPFANGKFNPRQSVSFNSNGSPFQFGQQAPQWMPGMNRSDSPSFAGLNGLMSPQSPYGVDGIQPTGSPGFNVHQRQQSLQYPMLQHQQIQQQQTMRGSPRLQEVREDEEDGNKSPSKTPEPPKQNDEDLQAEIDDAEYHLEEQFRSQLEHEDYNPQDQSDGPSHKRRKSLQPEMSKHFANEPGKPMELHHPRPHSRGHSLTQNNYFENGQYQLGSDQQEPKPFAPMNGIPEAQKTDDAYDMGTNPSDLGAPAPNFDVSAPFGQHKKTASNSSNPWSDAVSAANQRRPSHGNKPSFSKLNVEAPEFKFNPESTFTPGQFSFGGATFEPTVFQAGVDVDQAADPDTSVNDVSFQDTSINDTSFNEISANEESILEPTAEPAAPESSIPSFTGLPKAGDAFASFAPGQSEFSFSSSGPKFRPDAPSFTPFQAVTSPPPAGSKHAARPSIFGNIRINTSDIVKPAKKSKAIPIIRPSSQPSPQSPEADASAADDAEGSDRRPTDESRAKRAKSQAPDDDDVPLFAEQPKQATPTIEEEPAQEEEATQADVAEDISANGDHALAADTSMSSMATNDQVDTKDTTAAPSEVSQAEANVDSWSPFEFDSKFDATSFSESRPVGDDSFQDHRASLSAHAEPFVPDGVSGYDVGSEKPRFESPAEDASKERSASPTPKPKAAKGTGLGASRFASPPPKPKGLAASRFASEPSPPPAEPVKEPEPQSKTVEAVGPVEQLESFEQMEAPAPAQDLIRESIEQEAPQQPLIELEQDAAIPSVEEAESGQSFEEIDAIMQELDNDPSKGVNRVVEPPARGAPIVDVTNSPTYKFEPPADHFVRDNASPREYQELPTAAVPALEDPFVDPQQSQSAHSEDEDEPKSPVVSDWEEAFSADEHDKLDNRAQFFDGRVNEVVGNLLASRLEPLEQTLFSIQDAIASGSVRAASSRRDMRSVSADRRQSDADDEDEEPAPRRSLSPRRDRKMEQIRAAVLEGLSAHQRAQPTTAIEHVSEKEDTESALLKAINEMKEQMATPQKPGFGDNELKDLIENAVQSKVPAPRDPDVELLEKMQGLQSKVEELEEKLQAEKARTEEEVVARRTAEDNSSELARQLQNAETRVEVEIMNKSVFDQRTTDLEERLRHQEAQSEEEVENRRKAEDRLSEVQRLLRISSEEEARLRELNEESQQRIKTMEQANGKTNMKMALLEASSNNSTQSQSELTNKVNALEADLRAVRQDNNHWRTEAERSDETARRNAGELAYTLEENKHIQKSLSTLTNQLEENERLRESWRAKYMSLQDDMSAAAREIAEENAKRIKKDQAMFARQEVLDARLQAEAKTRERLEIELDRLQTNERTGMRATKECERLEGLLGELRTENHRLEQRVLAAQREFEEARESGLSEVKRTRLSMQTEIDQANHQVNVISEELEEQNNKLRAELDSFKLDADTAKARNDMLLEEAETTKATEIEELKKKHQNELEDMQDRYEQKRSVSVEESQKTEQNLLERLSFSATRIEHLQDRIYHLEEKLEISKEAAAAAAAAAKSAGVEPRGIAATPTSPVAYQPKPTSAKDSVPEKISPQALRESIMVLQEQLQAREQRIEELEQTVAKSDPDAGTKISKRDDEISWLRELLAVRQGDLQDIIGALSSDSIDRVRVKDAAIRLKASLQMEEQERERAMNGGSAITLPNIAQSIQSATPKVAQTIGAAWGSWRKGSTGSFTSMAHRLNSPAAAAARHATPSKAGPAPQNLNLGGLMTPPASGIRQSPLMDNKPQPTAFGSTGRRFPSQGNASGSNSQGQDRRTSTTSRRAEKMPAQPEASSPQPEESEAPMTPPMMGSAVYDSDAQAGDFDDDGFFVDE